jgi:hypothetical protein
MSQAMHSDRTALAALSIVLGPLLMSVGALRLEWLVQTAQTI